MQFDYPGKKLAHYTNHVIFVFFCLLFLKISLRSEPNPQFIHQYQFNLIFWNSLSSIIFCIIFIFCILFNTLFYQLSSFNPPIILPIICRYLSNKKQLINFIQSYLMIYLQTLFLQLKISFVLLIHWKYIF